MLNRLSRRGKLLADKIKRRESTVLHLRHLGSSLLAARDRNRGEGASGSSGRADDEPPPSPVNKAGDAGRLKPTKFVVAEVVNKRRLQKAYVRHDLHKVWLPPGMYDLSKLPLVLYALHV
jgi:hypothetical protein